MKRVAPLLFVLLLAGCGRPTPEGYWEGTASSTEVPMQDNFRKLTRSVDGGFWFVVTWDAQSNTGSVVGEYEGSYEAELKVENLPKVTAPAPGGNVKFEPEIGGTLTDLNKRRKFAIVGVLTLPTDNRSGALLLAKFTPPDPRTDQERLADEAAGRTHPSQEQPLEFTLRADPGVSGSFTQFGGTASVDSGGVTADAGGLNQNLPGTSVDTSVIVQKIPMTPFSPCFEEPGKVEKREGGPFAASFEKRDDRFSVKWSATQSGGERRRPPELTPEMREEIERLRQRLHEGR